MFLHQLLFIILMIIFPKTSNAYSPNCPDHSQKKLREIIYCKNNSAPYYSCLCDSSQKYVSEFCKSHLEYAPPGQKYIYSGGLRNVKCSIYRFQPFVLYENVSEKCLYQKYSCNEEGQVIYDNGSGEKDRTCTCDYTKNYSFIIQPQNKCFCIPGEEDCSCFINKCTVNGTCYDGYVAEQRALTLQCPIQNRTITKSNDHPIRCLRLNETHNIPTNKKAHTNPVIIAVLTFGLIMVVIAVIILQKVDMYTSRSSCISKNADSKQVSHFFRRISSSDLLASHKEKSINGEFNNKNIWLPIEEVERMNYVNEDSIDDISHENTLDQQRTLFCRKTGAEISADIDELSLLSPSSLCDDKSLDNTPDQNHTLIYRNTEDEISADKEDCSSSSLSSTADETPMIIISKKAKQAEAGQQVTLDVTVSSAHLRSVEWILKKETGHKKLDTDTDSSEYVGGTLKNPKLTIVYVTPYHAGEYICLATNEFGRTTSDPITLSVTIPKPVVKLPSASQYGVNGSIVILNCIVKSPCCTVESVEWIHIVENIEIIIDTKTKSKKYMGGTVEKPSLIIKDFSLDDTGTYMCQVKNKIGTTRSNPAQVDIKGTKPKVYMEDEQISGNAGDSVQINCYVQSQTLLKSIIWLRATGNTWNIVDAETYTNKYISKRCDDILILTINNLAPKDSGQYRCVVDNGIYCATSNSATIQVQIETPFVEITKKKKSFKVLLAGTSEKSVTLSYHVSSLCAPEKSLEWIHQKKHCEHVINISALPEKYIRRRKHAIESLKIKNLTHEDTGMYKCRITNKIGSTISKPYKVAIVKPPPPLIIFSDHKVILSDSKRSQVTFLIISKHGPVSVVLEKKRNGERKQLGVKDFTSTDLKYVKICSVEIDEPGIYICHATNAVKSFSSQKITVYSSSDSRENIKLVAAFDIGSSYSKYAFAPIGSLRDFPKIPASYTECLKTIACEPTCILLTEMGAFFGNEAVHIYEENIAMSKQTQNYFFIELESEIYEKKITSDQMLFEDVRGQQLPALDVYTGIIRALTAKVMNDAIRMGNDIQFQQVLWIVTVLCTSTSVKEFWVKCFEKAGIHKDKFMIVGEATAAVTYAIDTPPKSITTHKNSLPITLNGTFLLVDIGGFNCHISAIQKVNEDELLTLCQSCVENVGGKLLEQSILDLIENIVDSDVLETLQRNEAVSFYNMRRNIEFSLREFFGKTEFINFTVPVSVLDILCKRFIHKSLVDAVDACEKRYKITLKGEKMYVNKKLLESSNKQFEKTIASKIHDFLSTNTHLDVTHLLLVGGLSNSLIVQNALKNVPNKTVILPDDPNFAVVKGAILYWRKHNILTTRVAQYSYVTLNESEVDGKKTFSNIC